MTGAFPEPKLYRQMPSIGKPPCGQKCMMPKCVCGKCSHSYSRLTLRGQLQDIWHWTNTGTSLSLGETSLKGACTVSWEKYDKRLVKVAKQRERKNDKCASRAQKRNKK